jgi:hypothetical protein
MKKIIIILSLLFSAGVCAAAPIKLHIRAADSVLICDSKYAQFYHTRVCNGLTACKHQVVKISKEEALKKGYKSCPICYPRVRTVPNSSGGK